VEQISRGDIVLAAVAGDFGKPRPWLVVQADKYNARNQPSSVLVCPLTTYADPLSYRIAVELESGDDKRLSWVMVDKLMAIRRERIKHKICSVPLKAFHEVEAAMKDLLGII
jgi:mRNA interferase MazF